MSEPTWNITSEYRPDGVTDLLPWIASAERIADGYSLCAWAASREAALANVRDKIRASMAERQSERFTADENGDPIPSSIDAHRASRA